VKEKRKGPIGRAAGIAEGVAAAVRRMQREREPRILVYDATGYARLVQLEARGEERILELAEQMLRVAAGEDDSERGPSAPEKARRRPRGGGSEEAA
jgi:hypothetical protein